MPDTLITEPSISRKLVRLPLLVLIAFSGTLAMHIFVPALPQAASALRADSQIIQLTITIYILGLALGQLIYGPLSDAIGRRPAVFGGLCIYMLGSVAAYFAPTVEWLIAARLMQSLGGAGGLVLTRAIVSDMARGANATRGLALLNLVLLVAPGFAPIIGAYISEHLGWNAIFLSLALMAAFTMLCCIRGLPETAIPTGEVRLRMVATDFMGLLGNPRFLTPSLGGSFASTGCYAYFVVASFILNVDMGLDIELVGYLIALTLVAAAAGSVTARIISGRINNRRVMISISIAATLNALAFLTGALTGWLTPAAVVIMSCVTLYCAGVLSPMALGVALSNAGKQAGSAAGIYGFFQMSSGVICTFIVGLFADHALGCGIGLTLAYGFSTIQFLRKGMTR